MEYRCVYSFVGRRSTTAETTAAAAQLGVTSHMFFSHSRTLAVPGTFLRILYNNIHHHVAFARELEEKEKTPSRTNQQYVVQQQHHHHQQQQQR